MLVGDRLLGIELQARQVLHGPLEGKHLSWVAG